MNTSDLPKNSIISRSPGGLERDVNDDSQARQGRERHEGFLVMPKNGVLQPPPFFFTHDHHPVPLVDHFKGRSAFLIAGGPSFKDVDKKKLNRPGIMTMAMNNVVKVYKPNMWCCVDSPSNFIISNWLDPRVTKFVPVCHTQKLLFDNNKWERTELRVMDCPNVLYYKRNEHFKADQYLDEDTINWGCHKKYGGGRSVLFATVRILYLLGFRRIYLLGVDLDMDEDKKYAFKQSRTKSSIKGNNATYKQIRKRFGKLKPIFEDRGLCLYNCNPSSKLDVFPFVSFDDAVNTVHEEEMMGIHYATERTEGLYDREANEKKKKEKEKDDKKMEEAKKKASSYTDEERREIKKKLDLVRKQLDDCKGAVEEHKNEEPSDGSSHDDWEAVFKDLKKIEETKRTEFRACEDEKRVKWGEPPRWGLWEG